MRQIIKAVKSGKALKLVLSPCWRAGLPVSFPPLGSHQGCSAADLGDVFCDFPAFHQPIAVRTNVCLQSNSLRNKEGSVCVCVCVCVCVLRVGRQSTPNRGQSSFASSVPATPLQEVVTVPATPMTAPPPPPAPPSASTPLPEGQQGRNTLLASIRAVRWFSTQRSWQKAAPPHRPALLLLLALSSRAMLGLCQGAKLSSAATNDRSAPSL
jgi:hypothetical protein